GDACGASCSACRCNDDGCACDGSPPSRAAPAWPRRRERPTRSAGCESAWGKLLSTEKTRGRARRLTRRTVPSGGLLLGVMLPVALVVALAVMVMVVVLVVVVAGGVMRVVLVMGRRHHRLHQGGRQGERGQGSEQVANPHVGVSFLGEKTPGGGGRL